MQLRKLPLLLVVAGALAACEDSLPPPPHLISVAPDNGPVDLPTKIVIRADGLMAQVVTDFNNPQAKIENAVVARLGDYDLMTAAIAGDNTIEATVQPGLPMGTYSLTVIDRFQRATTLPAAYTVRVTRCGEVSAGDCGTCGKLDGCACGSGGDCAPRCGDGVIREPELCDDANLSNGDGCSSACEIEAGFVCSGTPSHCAWSCGDGVRTAIEACDDGNRLDGDGCSSGCVIEAGYSCTGDVGAKSDCRVWCGDGRKSEGEECDDGNLTAGDGCSDTCTVEQGWSCTVAGQPCNPVCGDGQLRGREACDDGNRMAGDGCSAACTVEPGYACGTPGEPCTVLCGDGRMLGAEECDDSNLIDGDGCSSTCTIEPGFNCGGTAGPCVAVCGDGMVAGAETCDDRNLTDGDGCSSSCRTEPGYSCSGTHCHPVCGDGLVVGSEGCDDGNTRPGDGCSDTCARETGWTCGAPGAACTTVCGDRLIAGAETCDDGNSLAGDGCSHTCTLESGWTCGAPGTACSTVCGDGIRAGFEACDDGNASSGDGCSSSCTPERGFICAVDGAPCTTTCGDGIRAGSEACDDGGVVSGDGCSAGCALEVGWACAVEGRACTPVCGDSMIVGGERCDDGNASSGDGCSSLCLVEAGYTCAVAGHACTTTCGDGIVAGAELCDDGNTASGDGCTSGCGVEVGWTCARGGYPCTPICGDSLLRGTETCDDGNAVPGDGCDAGCLVEAGWVCATAGSACTTVCGDAIRAGAETCDDGNLTPGDGCDAGCLVEAGWACELDGLVCTEICGDALLVGDETCDDHNSVSGDGCSDLCFVETGFVCPTLGAPCAAICGDGLVRGAELCDDANLADGDGCEHDCRPTCGNGHLDPGEDCDDGNYVGGDACEADCTIPLCGNGVRDSGEECDDHNYVDGDGCDANCTATRCGNGITTAGEECDDGNALDDDGCTSTCAFTRSPAPINADGVYHQWTPATGTHYTLLTAGCNTTTSIYTTRVGNRDTFVTIVLTVPPGAIITDIEATPCAASHTGAPAQFSMFYRLNDVDSNDSAPYTVSGTTMTALPTTIFPNVGIPRAADSTLEVGVVLTGGTGGVNLSGLTVSLRWYSRPFPAPDSLTAVHSGGGNVDLYWTDTTTWESNFRLERSVGVPGNWMIAATTPFPDTVTYRDAWLPEDQTIYYRVRAIDAVTNSESPWSNIAHVVTAAHVPATPRNAAVVAGTPNHITWVDASTDEDTYRIERRSGGGAFSEIGFVDADITSYDDSGCTGSCDYRIRALNVIGYSGYSNIATAGVSPPSGPDLNVSITPTGRSDVGSQTTTFTVNWNNAGTTAAPNAVITTQIPTGGTFLPTSSSLDWQCHNAASDYFELVFSIGRVLRTLKHKFPNVKQVLISSHNWAGYVPPDGGLTEPFAYEGGMAVKRAVAAQIHQMRTGELDPLLGNVSYLDGTAPWASWAFYHWANGSYANGYGYTWPPEDYIEDHTHLSVSGRAKVANIFMTYLLSSPWTAWFQATTVPPPVVVPPASRGPGLVPLIDYVPGEKYFGLEGGLFDGYSNTIPLDHRAAGIDANNQIVPRDVNGNPDPSGKVVMIGIGYSNSAQTMVALIGAATGDPRVRPVDQPGQPPTDFQIVNCAGGGGVARNWADPDALVYETCTSRLGTYSANQVAVVWFNCANNANITLARTMSGTAAGTTCRLPIGALAAGASGSAPLVVRSTFNTPTVLTLTANAQDDGSAGTDMHPLDNVSSADFTPGICLVPGGPACSPP